MRVKGVKFAIVPEWVIDKLADKPRALAVYCRLARWSNANGDTERSRKELAEICHVTVNTIDRALTDLAEAGTLIITPQHDKQGNRRWNLYTLTTQPVPYIPPPPKNGATLPPKMGRQETKPQNETASTQESTSARRPKTSKEIRHDRMVTAFVESFGWKRDEITENQWGQLHKAAKMLTEIDANPGDVHGRMLHYPELFRGAACTPLAVASHWALTEGWRDLIDEEET